MNLLLSGGTGFLGRSFLRKHFLCNNLSDVSLTVITRDQASFVKSYPEFRNLPVLRFLQADIRKRFSLPWGDRFTHVLHAATDSTVGPSLTPLQRYDQIVDGTRNILDLAVATGARRFLLTSSGAIYGPQPPDLPAISEGWYGSPPLAETNTAYGQAKRAAEHLCALYAKQHGLETVVARCFAFVGMDLPLNVNYAIGNFIRDALTADVITVAGDGTPLRTYLDQSDLANWLFTLLERGRSGEVYNVGSDEVISISQLAYLVRDILSPTKEVVIQGGQSSNLLRSRYIPDISKIKNEFGLKVSIPLPDAIRLTGAYVSRRL